jgi:cytoskeletal protein RodZ
MSDRVRGAVTLAMVDRRPERHAGAYLLREREERDIPLEDVAHKTKIKIEFLRLLEQGRIGELPAEVFVRGFARAYAQAVGASPAEASRLLTEQFQARSAAAAEPPPVIGDPSESESHDGRRRVGVVLVVLVILIAATLTLSLLLRRPGPSAGGISANDSSSETRLG